MQRHLRIFLWILLIPLLLASGAIGWLCYTASGLQFALLQLNHVPNLKVQLRGVTGKLAGPLHVDHISLDHERVTIEIDQLDIDLTPAYLLSGLIEVNRLQVASVKATLKPPTRITPDEPIYFLPKFLRISVDQLELQRAEYVHTSGYDIVATPLQGSASLSRGRLRVTELNAITQEFDARGEVVIDAGALLKLQAKLNADYKLPNGPTITGDVVADGPMTGAARELNWQALLHQPHDAVAKGTLQFPDSGWSLQGDATADKVLLNAWWPQPVFSLSKLTMQFQLNADGMHYVGDMVVPEWSSMPLHVDADTKYAARVFTIARADISMPKTGLRTRTAGSITLRDGAKPWVDVQANWMELQWPLPGAAKPALFTSAQGATTFKGALPYQLTVNGQVALPQGLRGEVQANGELRPREIQVAHYNLNLLQGTAQGSMLIGFGDSSNWQFDLQAQNINPGELQPAWPGNLTVNASGEGQGYDAKARFDVSVRTLTGVVRKQAVKMQGRLRRQGNNWQADGIDAQWGRTHATAQGVIGAQNNLRWSVTAPDLQQLYPELAGELNANGEFTGTAESLQLLLSAQSSRLSFAAWQADALKLTTQVDLTNSNASKIDLSAARIIHGDTGFENVALTGTGAAAEHQVSLQATPVSPSLPKGLQFDLQLAGRYLEKQWHATLNTLQVKDDQQATRLHLLQPTELLVAADQGQAQPLCVALDGGKACADGEWHADAARTDWNVHATLQDLPLSISNSALTDSARLKTQVNGQLDLSARGGMPWQGSAQLQLTNASIRYKLLNGREEALPISVGELRMTADARAVQTTAELRIGEQTVTTLTATLDRSVGKDLDSWPLSGVVSLSSSDAKLIPVFISEVDRASGTLAAALKLSGTATAPRFAGNVHLLEGELDFYQLNLALRALQFDAQLDNDQVQFTAKGNAGEGLLNATGNLSWRDTKLKGNLQLKGDRLLVADLPEYRVFASPDLNFDINDKNVDVKGEVLIPEATLQPKEVVGAVQTSADAHFKTDKVFDRQASAWTINSNVSIRLGDKVSFDGLGLQGQLSGAVDTRLRTGGVAVGSGELSINSGRYEIYGQKLDIKRGRLIYDNTALSDPGLDIQAERKINDTTVGVNVRGVLRAPRLQFYSDPSMSQTQIVSYLLIGKPLDELQSGEATTVRSASNTLAIQGGGYLAAQLGRRIGLEQVGVETDANNQSALVLGKFLSPRLFVSYGISLTEAINTVKLRYTLSDHWTIKTEAGEAKSADLEYKIER